MVIIKNKKRKGEKKKGAAINWYGIPPRIDVLKRLGFPFKDDQDNANDIKTKTKKKKFTGNKKEFINRLLKRYQFRKTGFNHRQVKAIRFLMNETELSNSLYQSITGCDKRTASRDLTRLVKMGVLERYGKGRGTFYILKGKRRQNKD